LGRGRDDILPAQICFHAQQAAEKALKAVLLAGTLGFPLSHDIQELLTIANQGGLAVPSEVAEAVVLTPFAVEARYPGYAEEITLVEVDAAIRTAEVVVGWATTMVTGVDVETSAED
jgi:HEPN domain-containing protein